MLEFDLFVSCMIFSYKQGYWGAIQFDAPLPPLRTTHFALHTQSATAFSPAAMIFSITIVVVTLPTPPGTGVMAPATSATAS